ncbi:hypothetical protein [Campylobacter suis]|uniref:Cytochrome c-type protein TorC n=1 Tax=Campylobacter suis TaxID=2790657 RepID=A0ABN7KAK2_9BACT|nr:hypothetical protein [Campylobacter suis]CAD7287890.1 Cytochrome c-type protein TorC [Campylobacter suis]
MKKILAISTVGALLAGGLFAADMFVNTPAPILDKVGGKPLGQLLIGAKVTAGKQSGEYIEVSYTGFVPGETPNAYARVGVLEQDITVENPQKTFKIVKKHKDDYDNEWDEVTLKGFVKKEALVGDIGIIHTAGENLFKERCGGCHALHGYDEFSANVWPSVVESMIGNSALTGEEVQTLNRFLQSKAPAE